MHKLIPLAMLLAVPIAFAHMAAPIKVEVPAAVEAMIRPHIPQTLAPMPLYPAASPNAIAGADEELRLEFFGMLGFAKVSRPTLEVFRPPAARANGSAIVIFPGGAYQGIAYELEGKRVAEALQDRGFTAIVVKYRLPSDATMHDKTIGPLQDAQQAIRVVRQHAGEWNLSRSKIGVMGFSAGGHLASTLSTHFSKALVENPDKLSLRPDFAILVYPVISMDTKLTHADSRTALLGKQPSDATVRLYSNELQVTPSTPPTLLLAAGDDDAVSVDNSIAYYQALQRNKVPAQMVLFPQGGHGFFALPRDEWMAPLWSWLAKGGWASR